MNRSRVLTAQRFCSEASSYLYDLENVLSHARKELNKIERSLKIIIEHTKDDKTKEEAQNALKRIDNLFTGKVEMHSDDEVK